MFYKCATCALVFHLTGPALEKTPPHPHCCGGCLAPIEIVAHSYEYSEAGGECTGIETTIQTVEGE
jgi:hypothetical protein